MIPIISTAMITVLNVVTILKFLTSEKLIVSVVAMNLRDTKTIQVFQKIEGDENGFMLCNMWALYR